MTRDQYENPLISRYASAQMSEIWSPQRKFSTWRRLWIALAECQQTLGLAISDAQLDEMRAHQDEIDFARAAEFEKKLRHDVMAHVHAFGEQCPEARKIIHLGATSCFVTDNTDLLLLRESLQLTIQRLARVLNRLADFAESHRNLACLAFTHLQPAQPTTVGKRATLWAQDLLDDLATLQFRLRRLRARGTKGTTGTQASFLKLFEGDAEKVKSLDRQFADRIGFDDVYPVTGQTYSRKIDAEILDALSGLAQSAHKMATDLRLLASRKEMEEPFETSQIGSSAMAYKRNPMRSERICGLARFVISLQSSAAQTLATQWMERTLDDSANRRLVLPQAFLATDAILILLENVTSGMVVYPQVIDRNLRAELPFMCTENILMAAVAAGGDRQSLHESIREHSQAAAAEVKQHGRDNDLLERLAGDPDFQDVDLAALTDPASLIGRAPDQVTEFVEELRKATEPLETERLPAEVELKV